MSNVVSVGDLVAVLAAAYPPELAESWDAIGLVCGDPTESVRRIVVCVDPLESIVDEAIKLSADLIVAHHPLLLRGVHGVSADTAKGTVVHRLIRAGIALYCAHTNADHANPGVSDALAQIIGLTVLGPLVPNADGHTGAGRIGELPAPETFSQFVRRVAEALPPTVQGVRGTGDPDRLVRTIAVCGGAGDSYLEHALCAGVDVMVTADLRHHPASEHMARRNAPALVDVAHWASEQPWCEQAADILRQATGGTVDVRISTRRTDPWTTHVSSADNSYTGRAPA